MHRSLRTMLFSCAGAALLACGGGPQEPIGALPRELSLAEQKLVTTSNRFAFNSFREIARQSRPDSNLFISPLSAAMALGMTYNGARGETQTAMALTLGLEGLSTPEANESFHSLVALLRSLDPKVDFRLANSIWYRLGFTPRPEFLDVNRQYFDARVQALDFSRADGATTINQWVDDNTNGRIPKIIDAIVDPIVMLLINAIYFKSAWVHQFDKSLTQSEMFNLRGGEQSAVSMMHRGAASVGYYVGQGFRVADLPYGGGAFSMSIVLPDPGRDLDTVVARLNQDAWDGIVNGLASESGRVALPRFRLEWNDYLNGVLKALGMGIAFTDNADFSGIAGKPGDLLISFVKQGTFVDVNEEGTEAAAATVVGIGTTSAGGPPEFRVDRPFAFVIRERYSGTILFMGRIMHPAAPS